MQSQNGSIEKVETVFSTPWFAVLAKTLAGEKLPYYSLRLSDYACVVALTKEGEFVLVRQYRPAVEASSLELPSGHVEPGESPLETAKRELEEETGMVSDEWHALGGPLFPDSGRLTNKLWCFFAKNATPALEARRAEDSARIQPVLFSRLQMQRAVRDGSFNHALHLAPLLLVLAHGHLHPSIFDANHIRE